MRRRKRSEDVVWLLQKADRFGGRTDCLDICRQIGNDETTYYQC